MGHLRFLGMMPALAAFCFACSSAQEEANALASGGSPATGGSEATGGDSQIPAGTGGQSTGTGGTQAASTGGETSTGGANPSGTGGNEPGTPSACDPSVTEANRTLVGKAIDELFIDKDLTAIDRYWAEPYLQHNPAAASGITTFKSVMGSFVPSASFQFTRLRTFADCDLVVVQGSYSATGVIFDMFRIMDGKIMEHWDSDANQASATEGPSELADLDHTALNRAVFDDLFAAVIASGSSATFEPFLASTFITHRAQSNIGPSAWADYLDTESIVYAKVHHQVVDGNFVFALSEGTRNGTAYGFYDLFRLEDGLIVEHWDSRRAVPDSTASGLEIF